MPMETGEWWTMKSEEVLDAVVGFFAKLWESIVDLLGKVVDAALKVMPKIILDIINAIMWLIELLIKAILLAYIWMMLAIVLVLVNALYLGISGIIQALNYIYDFNIKIFSNRIEIYGNDKINLGYNIGKEYFSYLNIDIPTIEAYFDSNEVKFEFKFGLYSSDIGFSKFPNELMNTTSDDWITFLTSMGSIWGLCGGGYNAIAVTAHLIDVDYGASFSISTALWIVILILSIKNMISNLKNPALSKPAHLGMGLGFIIASIAAVFPSLFINIAEILYFISTGIYEFESIKNFFQTISLILKIIGLSIKLWEEIIGDLTESQIINIYIKCIFALLSGFIGLITGSYNILTIPIIVRIALSLITLNLGVFFIAIGSAEY